MGKYFMSTSGINENIPYKCGHAREVVGPRFGLCGNSDEMKMVLAWRARLEALPCLPCRIENARSWGALEKMCVRPVGETE